MSPRVDSPGAGSPRVPELDAIRGLAALAVLIFHINTRRLPWGWAAVDLFFVLSGYLITGIVVDRVGSARELASFYVRRAARIWPAYYLAIALGAAASLIFSVPRDWRGLGLLLVFGQGTPEYVGAPAPAFLGDLCHLWTLAVEQQFYLLWPVLVLLVGRRGVIPLALLVIAGSVHARSAGMNPTLLAARSDGLALGGMLAVALPRLTATSGRSRLIVQRCLAALALGAFACVAALGGFANQATPALPPRPGPTILAFDILWASLVSAVALASGGPLLRWLRARWLTGLGTISYGLYLYHPLVIRVVLESARWAGFPRRTRWMEALILLGALGLARLSWVVLEEPILLWMARSRGIGLNPAHPTAEARRRVHGRASRAGVRRAFALRRDSGSSAER